MNNFKETIERQGQWFTDAMDIMRDHRAMEVLPCLFELRHIEQYVNNTKTRMISEIQAVFSREYYWPETGDPVEFDPHFFDYYLQLSLCNVPNFKKFIQSKKTTTSQLSEYYKRLVEHPEFNLKEKTI